MNNPASDHDFDQIIHRRDSDSIKWNKYPEDVLPLWVADMDFHSPPGVIHALEERLDHGIFGYPEIQEGTRNAVIDWLWQQHNWSITKDDLIFLPGVVVGFNLAAHALTQPGDGVLVQTPTYKPFLDIADNVGIEQHAMILDRALPSGEYQISQNSFRASIQPNTQIFMLCNPQNPTGRVFSRRELETMANLCLEHDIYICADEIHHDIVFSGYKHLPIASLDPEIARRTITLFSPTKTFNIAGLKAAVAVITDQKIKERFLQAKQGLVGRVNVFGQVGLRAAYSTGGPWLNDLLAYLETNRDVVVEFVNQQLPGVSMAQPQGTYLAWLDCQGTGLDHPQQFFLKEARVGLNAGEWFGDAGKGFVRLNFGSPKELVLEGLQRMREALQSR